MTTEDLRPMPMSQRSATSPDRFHNDHCKGALVIQFVTEGGTGKQYFRFLSPKGVEGHAPDAEQAYERIAEIAKRMQLEVHEDIIYITT